MPQQHHCLRLKVLTKSSKCLLQTRKEISYLVHSEVLCLIPNVVIRSSTQISTLGIYYMLKGPNYCECAAFKNELCTYFEADPRPSKV